MSLFERGKKVIPQVPLTTKFADKQLTLAVPLPTEQFIVHPTRAAVDALNTHWAALAVPTTSADENGHKNDAS